MKILGAAVMLVILSCGLGHAKEKPEDKEQFPSFTRQAYLKGVRTPTILRVNIVDCLAYALKKNNDIKIARIEPKVKSDDIRIARSEFEPSLNADYNLHDIAQKSTNIFYIQDSKIRDIDFNAGISGKLVTGAQYRMDFLNNRYKSNADIELINPYYTTEPIVTLTQPLFRGFGITVNRADIIIAKNNKKISDEDFKNSVMDIISQTKIGYYNYAYYLESYAIAESYVARARELLDINKARYAKGLVSSVDLLESEAAVADREKYLITAEDNLDTAEDQLKYITNIVDDPALWNARVELLDKLMFVPEKKDLVQSIEEAFVYRPDYLSKKIDLKNKGIKIVVTKNALLPTIDAVSTFGVNGIGKDYREAWDRVTMSYKDWSVGGQMTVPFGMGDRARYDRSKLDKARSILDLERMEQKIILTVRDRVREVDIQFRQERAAKTALEKEAENYAAQKERLRAGQVSTHDMLDYSDKLSRAELDHKKAIVDYSTALVNLDKEVGITLAKNNVKVEDVYEEKK